MSQPIRFTATTRRQYTGLTWAVLATVLVCTGGYLVVVGHDRATVAASCITAVVVGAAALGALAYDRSRSTFALHGTVLRSGGRHVDLVQVDSAELVERDPKALGPGARWSTLALTDPAGGRVKMMVTSKRIEHLYEPDDLRLIADLLNQAPLPAAQEAARWLHAFTAGSDRATN